MVACAAAAASVATVEVAAATGTATLLAAGGGAAASGYGVWSWLGYSAATGGAGATTAGTAAAGAAAGAVEAGAVTGAATMTGGMLLPAAVVVGSVVYAVRRYRDSKRLAVLSVDEAAAEISALAATNPHAAARLAATYQESRSGKKLV